MATIAETKHKAGRLLGIVAFDQSLKSFDDRLLQEAYVNVYDDLKNEGLAVWATAGTVPDRAMPHMAALMAMQCIPDKGTSGERKNYVLLLAGNAKPEIRKLLNPAYESLEEPADY